MRLNMLCRPFLQVDLGLVFFAISTAGRNSLDEHIRLQNLSLLSGCTANGHRPCVLHHLVIRGCWYSEAIGICWLHTDVHFGSFCLQPVPASTAAQNRDGRACRGL